MSAKAQIDLQRQLERFGLSSFRPGQREVISAVLQGHDCLCIMPTGGGKSLCYQLPAVARRGLTLVVSPLIALMKDQVDALHACGIEATFINSSLSLAEQRARLDHMAAGRYDLVYIAPERLRNPRFQEAIRKTRVQLLAVDEAHCISEWGHDFRPDYARLGRFRQRLKFPQTIALTATATPDVRKDVVAQLLLRSPKVFVSGFARANLRFQVQRPRNVDDKNESLLDFLRETPGAGIVYVSARKRCGEVAELIAERLKRTTGRYHAGLLPDERRQAQEDFMRDRVQIMVATNAFGMGIDKPDLRFVVHYNMPGTLEAYYQEAGRAGRDGKPSRCLLLFSYQDRFIQEFFIENAYPSREVVATVYDYLRSREEDPIEITLEDLKERLELSVGSEGVGACERLLEKCGAIERMDSMENKASVRIDSDLPTLVDLLPREAKVRRKVLQQIEKEVDQMRYERVYFHLQKLVAMSGLSRDRVMRALRELNKLDAFDYVPAFRGRAIHVLTPDKPFGQLDIDFAELDRRRAAEYEKLERVIAYADSRRCRQLEILDYFGDRGGTRCGVCDNCAGRAGAAPPRPAGRGAPVPSDSEVLRTVRIALSGVARARGRFGKGLVAKMLCGSKSAEVRKFGLSGLSTFGLLKQLTQTEAVLMLEELLATGLLQQQEIERNRPLIQLTERGTHVMRGTAELPPAFALPRELIAKLARTAGPDTAAETPAAAPESPADIPPGAPGLVAALRQWRRKAAEAAACPAYRVLTNAALEAIAATRPQSAEQLLAIKGIGPTTVRRYGKQLIHMVAEHAVRPTSPASTIADRVHERGPEDRPPLPDPSAGGACERAELPAAPDAGGAAAAAIRAFERRGAKPSFYWTWRLLADGYSPEQCQQIRRLDAKDVLSHALLALEQELPVPPDWFLSEQQQAALEAAIGDAPPKRMRALRERLPADIRVEHVQLYLLTRQANSS